MHKDEMQIVAWYGLAMAFLFLCMAVSMIWSSHQKADAYYRVTGKKVSAWDAYFLDLRVENPPK